MTLTALGLLAPVASLALLLIVRRNASAIALAGIAVSAAVAAINVVRVEGGAGYSATIAGLPDNPLWIEVTPLSAALAATVTIIGLLVLIYAVGYMIGDPDQVRFYAQMTFFVGAMQLLVLAGDWVLFLATWELIALASYLLIGFHFTDRSAGRAGTRAFLTTRVTDLGLYIGIFLLISQSGSARIVDSVQIGDSNAAIAAGLLLLVGAMGKAAQVPFQGWLEDAMAGPTPVSALLHSATLVAAGVILLVRAFPLFTSEVLIVVGVVGGVTTVATGLIALQEGDLKRMLAASTSSQLAFMLIAIGAGSWGAATIHLVAHAAMKSALFLGAGIFQHTRKSTAFAELAGVGKGQRNTFAAFVVAGLALAGIPPLVGFWSKDAIVSVAIEADQSWFLVPAALAGAALTGGYVARALRLLWHGEASQESPTGLSWMLVGLAILSSATVIFSIGVASFEGYLDVHIPAHIWAIVLGLAATGTGLTAGWLLATPVRSSWLNPIATARAAMSGLHQPLVVDPTLRIAAHADWFDRHLHRGVEGVGLAGLRVARFASAVEDRDHAAVESVGEGSMSIGWLSRRTDEDGIERLIDELVSGVRDLGGRARSMQTGLVSRELAYTAGAIVVLIGVLLSASQSLF